MMKLYIALSVVLLLLFSGCGNKPKPEEDLSLIHISRKSAKQNPIGTRTVTGHT